MKTRTGILVGVILAAAFVAIVVASRSNQPGDATDRGSRVIGLDTFRDIAMAQTPAVVNIRTESRRQTQDLSDFFSDELFERFFGFPSVPRPREEITEGAGSGFILDKGGLILTNNHVVAGANKITVAFYADESGAEYGARVVGRDPLTDSALLQLTDKPDDDVPAAKLGHSGSVRPGDWVMAIGNPFNLAHTVTVGVISAIERPFPMSEGHWQNVLQTDAAINPGNSGGPLLNTRGEVIGINSAILTSGGRPMNAGVGFAIPIDVVRELLPQLREGSITRGRIGVRITPVPKNLVEPLGLENASGALVRVVEQDGPAEQAGVEPGDVIVRFNGQAVDEQNDLVSLVTRTKPETTVPVELVRDGKRQTVRITVDKLDVDDESTTSGTSPEAGFGLSLRNLDPQVRSRLQLPQGRDGALIGSIQPGSGAARAGLRAGDVIVEVNRMAVRSASEAARALQEVPEGGTALLIVWRQGQEHFLTMNRSPQ